MIGYQIICVMPNSYKATAISDIVYANREEPTKIQKRIAKCTLEETHVAWFYHDVVEVLRPDVTLVCKQDQ